MNLNPKMMGLFMKYGGMRLDQLQADDLVSIASGLGYEVPVARATDFISALQTEDVGTVGDWLSRPDNFEVLKDKLLTPKVVDVQALKCPHCKSIFELDIKQ